MAHDLSGPPAVDVRLAAARDIRAARRQAGHDAPADPHALPQPAIPGDQHRANHAVRAARLGQAVSGVEPPLSGFFPGVAAARLHRPVRIPNQAKVHVHLPQRRHLLRQLHEEDLQLHQRGNLSI